MTNNGHSTPFFNLSRGVRQGCPLSPYLFILCVELLATNIRKNNEIKGIKINESEVKISQYADDTTIVLDGSQISLDETILTLDKFALFSGLQINFQKSNIVPIGSLKNKITPTNKAHHLTTTNGPVRLLGISFRTDKNDLVALNFEPQLKKIKTLLNSWLARNLSPIGKITIVKSLAISKLTFLFSVLPDPPKSFFSRAKQCYL